jgi:hypothetical protein
MSEIRNTTRQMQEDPAEKLLFLAEAMDGGPGAAIERQERDGGQQLVNSDRLPADMGDQSAYEALGFTFGSVDKNDPLFRPATLPPGWSRKAGEGDPRGSSIVDAHGRKRISVFYKAAFYDRKASMHLIGLDWYVTCHVEYDEPLVLGEDWATPETVAAALKRGRDEELAEAARHREYAAEEGRPEHNRARLREIAAEKDAVAAKYAQRLEELAAEAAS